MTRNEDKWDQPLKEKFRFLYKHIASSIEGDVVEFKNRLSEGSTILKKQANHFTSIDNNATRIARKASETKSVIFIHSELSNVKFILNSTIDHVVFFHGLQTCENTAEVIEEIHRILKPGGQLYLSVPNAAYKGPKLGNVITPFSLEDIKIAFKRYIKIRPFGVAGNERVQKYSQLSEDLFKKATRFNPVYKILSGKAQVNRINEINTKITAKLALDKSSGASDILYDDYYLSEDLEKCSDLFIQIEKCECEL